MQAFFHVDNKIIKYFFVVHYLFFQFKKFYV